MEVILTDEDLLAGANAGADDEPQPEAETAPQTTTQEVHVHHHIVEEQPVSPQVNPDPQITVDETAVLLDENGDVVNIYDRGTIDGAEWVAIDSDLNGKADLLGIDENRNGIIEENEIYQMDNKSYDMGQGDKLTAYMRDENGNLVKVYEDDDPHGNHYADNTHHQN